LDALTLTPTLRRNLAIMKLIEVVAARLRERLQGAQASPPVGDKYNPEFLIEWMSRWELVGPEVTQEEADMLCDEGESGNPRDSYD
jgi:hypothetical protein